jgi:7-cyano-7-deazaguanine synthase
MSEKALVMFSGGLDSTVCVAWALDRFSQVHTIGFFYGQNNDVEMSCRGPILEGLKKIKNWKDKLGEDHLLDISLLLKRVSPSNLISGISTPGVSELDVNFVPGRNLFFFLISSLIARLHGIRHIVGGMREVGTEGYPDCRDDTIKAMQIATNLGLQEHFVFDIPLMWQTIADTFDLAKALGGSDLLSIVVSLTHSCFTRDRETFHPWGYGCGKCLPCEKRAQGWREWLARGRGSP